MRRLTGAVLARHGRGMLRLVLSRIVRVAVVVGLGVSALGIAPRGDAFAGGGNSPMAAATVEAHARVRQTVGVGPLRWSPSLAQLAQNWAQQLCRRSRRGRVVLQHRPSSRFGENLHWQGGGDPPSVGDAVQSWANERTHYDPSTGRCVGGECGHYTQLVWRATTEVGCGAATCGSSHFTVCNYSPPGNFVGQRPY